MFCDLFIIVQTTRKIRIYLVILNDCEKLKKNYAAIQTLILI